MQANLEDKLNWDHDVNPETEISHEFNEFLQFHEYSQDEEEEEEEEEFSFVRGGEETSPFGEDSLSDGRFPSVFPLFNRDLLFDGGDSDALRENLQMRPPVKKVFVETNEENCQPASSASGDDEIAGSFCEWSGRKAVEASPEACKKCNSTGFSKIWRFKEFRHRCSSDGRDAFVFLNGSHAPASVKKQEAAEEKTEKKAKVEGKGKKASAHEVYLKSKAKEERRRSYLPYRPELMGFFTNVNGGLTRNVHPY